MTTSEASCTKLLRKPTTKSPKALTEQYVDDLSQYAEGNRDQVICRVSRAATYIIKQLRQMVFIISANSVIVAIKTVASEITRRVKAKTGITIKPARAARDLGIGFAVGTRTTFMQRA